MRDDRIFYSYIEEGFDRDYAVMEAHFDIDMNRISLALNHVHNLERIRCMQADLKLLTESGTYDDMMMLYTTITEEAEDEKQGFFSTMIERIQKFISDIFSAIARLFSGKAEEEFDKGVANGTIRGNVRFDRDPNEILSQSSSALAKLTQLIQPLFTSVGSDGERHVDVLKSIQSVVAIVEGIKTAKKIKDISVNGLKNIKNGSKKVLETCRNLLDKLKGVKKEDVSVKKAIEIISNISKEAGNVMKETGKKMLGFLKKPFSKNGNTDSNSNNSDQNGNNSTDKNTSDKNTNNNPTTTNTQKSDNRGNTEQKTESFYDVVYGDMYNEDTLDNDITSALDYLF